MAFTITSRPVENAVVLSISGRLTIGESITALHDAVEKHVAAGDKHIILDMKGITYVDSTGLGVLVTSLTCARNHGGSLRLANVSQRIQDLLDVSSLYMVFQIIELASTKIGD